MRSTCKGCAGKGCERCEFLGYHEMGTGKSAKSNLRAKTRGTFFDKFKKKSAKKKRVETNLPKIYCQPF